MKWIFAALSLIVQPFMPIMGELLPERASASLIVSPETRETALRSLLEIFGISPDASYEEIVADTQKLWLQKGKERWEFDTRYASLKPQIWPLFEQLGYLTAAEPRRPHYNYALIHGALLSRVEERTAYLSSLYDQGVRFDAIIFLSGARPLQNSEKQLLPNLSTEREMVEWVYRNSSLPKEIPVIFIDAPMRQLENGPPLRPQTTDTILQWLSTRPEPGSCLAISNQPYVAYQDAVVRNHLPSSFSLETVGPAPSKDPSVAILLDSLAKELYEKK